MTRAHAVAFALLLGCNSGSSTDDGSAEVSSGNAESGEETSDAESSTGAPEARPNWHEDIAPLVATNCLACHVEGGLAFSFESYESTAPYAPLMAVQTEERVMPPWHAVETEECEPYAAFEHDARLTQEEIDLIAAWADLGAPEGDPALAAPLPARPSLDLADPGIVVGMEGSITIEAEPSRLDRFHCLTFDPGFEEDVYLDGLQVIAGNTAIVHHVLVFVDPEAASLAWQDGTLQDCGQSAGVANAQLIGAWVPGGMPTEPPENVGIHVPAGSQIIFNVHYHASVTGPQTDDGTSVALRWKSEVPEWISDFYLIGAPGLGTSTTGDFMIPAGAAGHEEIIDWAVPNFGSTEVRLWAVGHHMHKVAVDAKSTFVRDGQERCLLQTPRWDFGWQRLYEYDAPIEGAFEVQNGDVFRIRCTYDNTLDNPGVVSALAEMGLEEPQDVAVGEETLDEMCLAGVGVAHRP